MRVLVNGENGLEAWEILSLGYDDKLFKITDIVNNKTSYSRPSGLVIETANGVFGIRHVNQKTCEEKVLNIAREGYTNLSTFGRYEILCGQKEIEETFGILSEDRKKMLQKIINS